MRGSSGLKGAVISLACLGLLLPEAAIMAVEPRDAYSVAQGPPPVIDIALGSAQTLRGTVVDPDGSPAAGAPVVLLSSLRPVASTETDPNGRFVFAGVRGGVYGVKAAGSIRVCRAWAPRTAPPTANGGLLIVTDGSLVRGRGPLRDCHGRMYTWMSEHPVLTYAGIAAAIAVPVAIVGSNQPKSP